MIVDCSVVRCSVERYSELNCGAHCSEVCCPVYLDPISAFDRFANCNSVDRTVDCVASTDMTADMAAGGRCYVVNYLWSLI